MCALVFLCSSETWTVLKTQERFVFKTNLGIEIRQTRVRMLKTQPKKDWYIRDKPQMYSKLVRTVAYRNKWWEARGKNSLVPIPQIQVAGQKMYGESMEKG